MSPALFDVIEHTIPTTHIREYPRALAGDQEDTLHLAVKQYTPKGYRKSSEQGVTVIGAHANGFPKELYEPLWDDLYTRLKARNIHINSIWIADVAQQGASGVLNEKKLGNDPSWADHPRDLFLMINHFRKHMHRPLIGIGHSMGGNNLINLATIHPRLFTSLILIDPVVQRAQVKPAPSNPAKSSARRRDLWPNRKEAAEKFRSSPFYQAWDPRVFDRWIQYGLRETPTYLHPRVAAASSTPPPINADPSSALIPPTADDKEVTLTTTKHQEVLTFSRANFPSPEYPDPGNAPHPLTHPDVDPAAAPTSPFYSPVPLATFQKLPSLRPSVFYVFGDPKAGGFLSEPVLKADKLANTGTGVGGSGGVKKGRVGFVTFEGVGHLIAMEAVERTADAVTEWLVPELQRWRTIEEAERAEWAAVPRVQKAMLSEKYLRVMTNGLDGEAVVAADGGKAKL